MKTPTHDFHMKLTKVPPTIDVNLQLIGKRRSKRGQLTISAFELLIDGKTIIYWSVPALAGKFTEAQP